MQPQDEDFAAAVILIVQTNESLLREGALADRALDHLRFRQRVLTDVKLLRERVLGVLLLNGGREISNQASKLEIDLRVTYLLRRPMMGC